MEWKDSKDTESLDDEGEGDFLEDDDYPAWQKPKKRLFGDGLLKKLDKKRVPFLNKISSYLKNGYCINKVKEGKKLQTPYPYKITDIAKTDFMPRV